MDTVIFRSNAEEVSMLQETRKKGSGHGNSKGNNRSASHRGTRKIKSVAEMEQLADQLKAIKADNDKYYSLGMSILQGKS